MGNVSPSADGQRRGLAGSSATVVVATVLQRAAAGLAVVVVIRTYGVAVAGIVGALQFVGLAAASAALLGSDTGLVRFVPALRMDGAADDEAALERTSVIWTAVASSAAAVLVVAALPLWHLLLESGPDDALTWLVVGTALAIPPTVLCAMAAAILRAHERFTVFALVDRAIGGVTLLVVIGILAAVGADAPWLGLAIVAGPVAALVVAIGALWRRVPVHSGTAHDPELHRRFWRFSLPRAPASLLSVANARVDTFLVAVLASTAAAGSYQLAARIAVIALLPVQATGVTVAPGMARGFARRDLVSVAQRYSHATRLSTMWSLPILAGLFAFANDITELVAPDVRDAATPLRIILVAMAIEVVTGRVNTVLLMAGRSALSLVNAASVLGVTVVLDLVLVPLLGGEGAAIAWIAGAITANALAHVELRRNESLRLPTVAWLLRATAVIVAAVAVCWCAVALPAEVSVSVVLGVALVAGTGLLGARMLSRASPGAVA